MIMLFPFFRRKPSLGGAWLENGGAGLEGRSPSSGPTPPPHCAAPGHWPLCGDVCPGLCPPASASTSWAPARLPPLEELRARCLCGAQCGHMAQLRSPGPFRRPRRVLLLPQDHVAHHSSAQCHLLCPSLASKLPRASSASCPRRPGSHFPALRSLGPMHHPPAQVGAPVGQDTGGLSLRSRSKCLFTKSHLSTPTSGL